MKKKILVVTSGGGHWIQLTRLLGAFSEHDVAFATVHQSYSEQVSGSRFYKIRDSTRWDKFGLAVTALQILRILLMERPQYVVTTGAAPGVIALRLGRFFKAKTVWIDSIANVEQLSLSGQYAGGVADLWLTQWEHLQRPEGPHYKGSVI